MSYFHLGPNQIDYERKELEKEKRIQRLKQVRAKAKELASGTLKNYRKFSQEEWEIQLDMLFRDWLVQKQDKLKELHFLMEEIEKIIGQSHRLAVLKENEKRESVAKLMKKLLQDQRIELKRSGSSARQIMKEEMARLEPALIKKALLKSIQEQERLRSRYVIEKYRATQTDHVPNIDFASRPLQKSNLRDVIDVNFDDTCHHRDYAAIRCVVEKETKKVNVVQAAIEEAIRNQQDQNRKIQRKEQLDIDARARYQEAINSVAMDQKKEKMIQELIRLQLQDRQRKQTNASNHASLFRPHFVNIGQEKNARHFKDHFQIEYAGGKKGIDVDQIAPFRRQRRTPLETISNESFEFINEGVVLLNK